MNFKLRCVSLRTISASFGFCCPAFLRVGGRRFMHFVHVRFSGEQWQQFRREVAEWIVKLQH